MNLRVTFDTNTLDLAYRPELFPNNPLQPHLHRVRDALVAGQIHGFYSVTMLTIEGVMKRDRAAVFAGTRINPQPEVRSITKNADLPEEFRAKAGGADIETFTTHLQVEQPDRQLLPPAVAERARVAHQRGALALKGLPRTGAFNIRDPADRYYLSNGEGSELSAWLDKAQEVAKAIECRGLGFAQVKEIGRSLNSQDMQEIWFKALTNTKDIHQERAVERSFSEWADGDAIASHVAYGIDVFCSNDFGRSNPAGSVLNSDNRAWLTATYGVRFMKFDELLNSIA